MSNLYFHFTLGPVQGFVAQARRTRDLWAGSFLLSYLTAVAIRETQAQGGEILFPLPDQNFISALTQPNEKSPKQGSIPNRFKAKISDDFDPEKITQAVQIAWLAIGDSVVKQDFANFALWQTAQKNLWDTQLQDFWEMTWGITPDASNSALLDQRKNWRVHLQSTQHGIKCMMMDGYQELSCAERPNTKAQKEFWNALRTQIKSGATDLRQGEMLCAMAYIKRRFVRSFEQLSVKMPSGWTLKGWKLPHNTPSVQYLAASSWLIYVLKESPENPQLSAKLSDFYHKASQIVDRGESDTDIRSIQSLRKQGGLAKPLTKLDGAVFFESLLEITKNFDADKSQIKETLQALKAVKQSSKKDQGASPFYAILLMDGDSLGIHMSNPEKQTSISKALERFTNGVAEKVAEKDGFLIYAGGDDVLALLPLEKALDCANALQAFYKECFKGTSISSTLSGAIEFVHIKSPLMKGISDAHPLLDDIAKDKTGRDSLAIRIHKPGNLTAQWSMPWEKAVNEKGLLLNQIADELARSDEKDPGFSSKFIYGLRDKYADFDFTDWPESQMVDLLVSSYLSSGNAAQKSLDEARHLIILLINQSRTQTRLTSTQGVVTYYTNKQLSVDAGLIARFLAQKGMER
jgi:CRISPR-associated protein Cmr2